MRNGAHLLLENARIDGGSLQVGAGNTLRLAHVSSTDVMLIAEAGAAIELVNSAIGSSGGCNGSPAVLISLGGNVFQGAPPCDLPVHPSDQQTVDLRLAEVQTVPPTAPTEVLPGSQMLGYAPLSDSPILDAAIPSHCPKHDQFGAIRPELNEPLPRCGSGAIEGPLKPVFGDGFDS